MTTQDSAKALRDSKFFAGLPDRCLTRLAEVSSTIELERGEELFHEHDKVKDVYLVLSGRVSLVICVDQAGCRQIDEVGKGEIVGWSPLLGRPRLFDTVRAVAPTKVLAIPAQELLDLCKSDHEFGVEFMQRTAGVLANRLAMTRQLVMERFGAHLPMDEVLESD